MKIPEFTADASLATTKEYYRSLRIANGSTVSGALPQLIGIGSCMAQCHRDDFSCLFDCLGQDDGIEGAGPGIPPSPVCGPCNRFGLQRCVLPGVGAQWVPCFGIGTL
jgi:hypothetical protein